MATRIESLVVRYKTFLAQASHEIGSPLTRLNIALALAKRTAGSQLHSELGRIGREADSLNSLVQELLLLARLESGNELTQEAVVYDVTSVVDEAAPMPVLKQMNRISPSYAEERRLSARWLPQLTTARSRYVLRNGLRFCRAGVVFRFPFSKGWHCNRHDSYPG